LAPDVADVRTQCVRISTLASPHVCVEATRGHHVTGVRREQVEDAELRRCEPDRLSAPAHLVCLRIEVQSLDLDAGLGLLSMSLAGAPEDGADPDGKLAELEGLGQEVIDRKSTRLNSSHL